MAETGITSMSVGSIRFGQEVLIAQHQLFVIVKFPQHTYHRRLLYQITNPSPGPLVHIPFMTHCFMFGFISTVLFQNCVLRSIISKIHSKPHCGV